MNDYNFGNFLYTLRLEKGLSQVQLGNLLGVTNKAVSKWENGTAKPNTSLIPRIAEIFGIKVEELFACKRFEQDCEYEKIKTYLSAQKRKYAILSSVFLAAIITIPLFLAEFICVIMGFQIADDVVGPLGAMTFIFAFIISITAYVIYRKNFKQAITPTDVLYTCKFIHILKRGCLFSPIIWWYIFVLSFFIYPLILMRSSDSTPANIYLLAIVFILISLLGTLIFFANTKRLLKIKFFQHSQNEKKHIPFSSLPTWGKICYVVTLILFPIVLNIQVWGKLAGDGILIKLTSVLILFSVASPLIVYRIKKK